MVGGRLPPLAHLHAAPPARLAHDCACAPAHGGAAQRRQLEASRRCWCTPERCRCARLCRRRLAGRSRGY
eukprot:4415125-Pyramimonas_sp.AAC.1